jgi:hypothetical protein
MTNLFPIGTVKNRVIKYYDVATLIFAFDDFNVLFINKVLEDTKRLDMACWMDRMYPVS